MRAAAPTVRRLTLASTLLASLAAGVLGRAQGPVDAPLCSATGDDGTVLELRVDSPLPGAVIHGTDDCGVTVSGVASAMGLTPIDIVFVIDRSGSTNECSWADIDGDGIVGFTVLPGCSDPGDSVLQAEIVAVRAVLDEIDAAYTRAGLIRFNDSSDITAPLTHDFDMVRAALDSLSLEGGGWGTEFVPALAELVDMFELYGLPDRTPVSLFLSDGMTTESLLDVGAAAADAADKGLRIDTFGVGAAADPIALELIADTTGGSFYELDAAGDIVLVLPDVTLVGVDRIEVTNLTTGEMASDDASADGSFAIPIPVVAGFNELEVLAEATEPVVLSVTCNTDVTIACGGGAALSGRMNGGGQIQDGPIKVNFGYTLRCDPERRPQRLEVNWRIPGMSGAERFHMTELISATCSDDPTIDPGVPKKAQFDTFNGVGKGRYNSADGATITFTLKDSGEPGRKDSATFVIEDAGGAVVLDASGKLKSGNNQAL